MVHRVRFDNNERSYGDVIYRWRKNLVLVKAGTKSLGVNEGAQMRVAHHRTYTPQLSKWSWNEV